MISGSNQQLQQQLKYTLLKPDCHSRWISKMQSGREEERYAKKFCCKLGKMPEERMECFGLLFNHLAWIENQFLSSIRDSRKEGSLLGMMRGVGGVRKSIAEVRIWTRIAVPISYDNNHYTMCTSTYNTQGNFSKIFSIKKNVLYALQYVTLSYGYKN